MCPRWIPFGTANLYELSDGFAFTLSNCIGISQDSCDTDRSMCKDDYAIIQYALRYVYKLIRETHHIAPACPRENIEFALAAFIVGLSHIVQNNIGYK